MASLEVKSIGLMITPRITTVRTLFTMLALVMIVTHVERTGDERG